MPKAIGTSSRRRAEQHGPASLDPCKPCNDTQWMSFGKERMSLENKPCLSFFLHMIGKLLVAPWL